MQPRSRIATLAILVLLLAGCTTGQQEAEARPDVPATASRPKNEEIPVVRVPGLESCSSLPISARRAPDGGEQLPDLSLPCLSGGPTINISELSGRPVVVNLWATWCAPCREEMPLLQDAYERHANTVSFVGVNTKDNPQEAGTFLNDVGVTYPQLVDVDGQLLGHIQIPGLPITLVLDRQGRVATRHVGPLSPDTLSKLLGESASDPIAH